MPSFPELTTPLSDGRVTVRLAAERDIPEVLIAYQDDPELHLRLVEERPPTGAELGRRTEQAEAERLAGRSLTLTIVEPGADICRGQLYVHQVEWDDLRAELGIWVSPQRRGRGLAGGALALAGTWLLREGGLERLALLTEPTNQPMIRAAEAAGFSHEGVLRRYMRQRDRRIDAAVLSLVRHDLGS